MSHVSMISNNLEKQSVLMLRFVILLPDLCALGG